jgi:hypothetical protein
MHRFAEFIEREAGYIAISLVLVAVGLMLVGGAQRADAAKQILMFALGVLARSMGGTKPKVDL